MLNDMENSQGEVKFKSVSAVVPILGMIICFFFLSFLSKVYGGIEHIDSYGWFVFLVIFGLCLLKLIFAYIFAYDICVDDNKITISRGGTNQKTYLWEDYAGSKLTTSDYCRYRMCFYFSDTDVTKSIDIKLSLVTLYILGKYCDISEVIKKIHNVCWGLMLGLFTILMLFVACQFK